MEVEMWVFEELSLADLVEMATRECECVTKSRAGTRNGFMCQAHRAQAELDKREAEWRKRHRPLQPEEVVLMRDLLVRYADYELDQWERWRATTRHGTVYISLNRERPDGGIGDEGYDPL